MENEFYNACMNGDLVGVKRIQASGLVEAHKHDAFYLACSYGKLNVVKYFIEVVGVDIHTNDDESFQVACYNYHLDIAEYLVGLGADLSSLKWTAEWIKTHGDNPVIAYTCNLIRQEKLKKLLAK